MKIYYFSGTGNTLFTAKIIADELKNKGMDTPIVNIESIKDEIINIDCDIILMFPVYAYGPPKIIKKFIEKLRRGEFNVYLILNYGLLSVNAYFITANLLKKKGYNVEYSNGVRMPANYINLYNPPKLKTSVKRVDKAIQELKIISDEIFHGKRNKIRKGFILLRFPMKIIYLLFVKFSDRMGGNFYADEKCKGCGICVKACPASNIKFDDNNRPVWNNLCEQCVRCIHLCPEGAIQWLFLTKKRRRYKNPHIKLEELVPPK